MNSCTAWFRLGRQAVARQETPNACQELEEGRCVAMQGPSIGEVGSYLSRGGLKKEVSSARNKSRRGDSKRTKLKFTETSKIRQAEAAVLIQHAFRRSQQVLSYSGGVKILSCEAGGDFHSL